MTRDPHPSRRAHLLTAAALALAVALLTGACGSTSKPAGASSGSNTNATFTYGTTTEVMVGWDPATDYSNEIIAMNNMYETLTRYDSQTGQVLPMLATSWKKTSDAKTWTFTIRPNVKFHTGRPMTAADVKAAIDRTIKLNGGASYIWGAVKSIDAPDARTVVFHLKYATPLDLVASAGYAAFIYDTKAAPAAQLSKWFAQGHDAGTGPYTVANWDKGQEVELRLKAFPGYWGGWSGNHYRNVVFRVVPTASTSAQLVRQNQLTWVEQLTPQLWSSLKSDPNLRTTTATSYQNLLGMLNTSYGPLKDPRVRQAIAYATDYKGITAALGAFTPSIGVIPHGLWGYDPSLPVYQTSTEKATGLLKEAGYGPGGKHMSLTLTYTQGDPFEPTVASLLKSELAPLNITVNVSALQWTAQWSKAKSTNPASRQDILLFYWWPDYADPYSWFINLFHSANPPYFNLAYYDNPEVDKQIDQVEPLSATNRPAAINLYSQIQTTLLHDSPALFLGTETYQRVMQKSVGGFVDNPAYPNVVFVYSLHPGQ
ncbi:MAG TPA: ABC transporter substrate-binding protein [Gaiellales bacterium]|nr:ABC transporter substrate-binding protein [Gaiellales bacterium]